MTLLQPVVIDASVAIKWFIEDDEFFLQEASEVLKSLIGGQLQGIVPSHFFAEMASTLYRKKRVAAFRSLQQILSLDLPTHQPKEPWLNLADQLMKKYPDQIYYDISYHALAMLQHGTFLTVDERYIKKTQHEGHIMHLKDWK